MFGNRLELFAELLALWHMGACVIPVDARLTAYEVEKLARTAQPRFAIVNDSVSAQIQNALADISIVDTRAHETPSSAGRVLPKLSLDDDALILFTSGSTGQPKGVVHTHRSLLARWSGLHQTLGLGAFERTLCVLPTHFGHGLICNCLFPWLSGCDLFIAPPFRPDFVMQLGPILDEHRITFMSSVPALWNLALRASATPRAGQLRRVHIGSAPLSAALWQQVQAWSGTRAVCNAYGITETGSWVAGTTGDAIPQDGLIGSGWGASIRVMPARTVAMLEEQSTDCATDEEGMIWLNTPALMKGYYQLPSLTEDVISGGWFNTGDIGLLDDRGRLFIRGRERDEINKGGMKVFPADIDAVVAEEPNVLDTCTFGIADPAYGENVALAIVLKDASSASISMLYERLATRLAEHKQPVKWYLIDEIPRTSRGKINRAIVGERCADIEPVDLRKALAGAKDEP